MYAFFSTFYSKNRGLAVILAVSVVMELAWFAVQNIGYHCDSPAYLQYAWRLLGQSQSTFIIWTRTPGYPLLMLLTGTAGTDGYFYTFKRLLAAQAVMAVLMPVLVYKTLAFYNRRVAFFGALFFIFSLAPFMESKLIMTEQLFKFLSLLLIYFLCRILAMKTCGFKQLLPLTLTLLFLLLTRPSAALICLTVFGILLAVRMKWWRPIGLCCTIPLGFLALFSLWLSLYTLPPFHLGWPGYYKPGYLSAVTELQFYDLYEHHPELLLDAQAGEKRAALKTVAERFIADLPHGWRGRTPFQHFTPYVNKPETMLRKIYEEPNRAYFLVLRDAVLTYRDMGPDAATRALAKRLIPGVINEVYLEHPAVFFEFWFRYMTAAVKTAGAAPQVLFFDMFVHDQVAKLKAENGPASASFLRLMKDHFKYNPTLIQTVAPVAVYKKDYTKTPEAMVDELFTGAVGAGIYFNSWLILDNYLGPIKTSTLFAELNKEGIQHGWVGKEGFYTHFFKRGMSHLGRFFLDPFVGGGLSIFGLFDSAPFYFDHNMVYCTHSQGPNGEQYMEELRSGMRWVDLIPNQLETVIASNHYRSPLDVAVHILWDIARIASEIIIVLGVWFCWRSKVMIPIAVCLLAIAQHSISASFMVGAQTRYVDQIQPMMIVCACLVLVGVGEYFRRKKRFSLLHKLPFMRKPGIGDETHSSEPR